MFDDATRDRPRGRPSRYSDETAAEICRRISLGESLQAICRDRSMPPERTVYDWLDREPSFSQMYVRAREQQVERYVDEIVDIADRVIGCTDAAVVNGARLAIDARKWAAAKRLPRKYGDRVQLSGDLDQPLIVTKIELVGVEPVRREPEAIKSAAAE